VTNRKLLTILLCLRLKIQHLIHFEECYLDVLSIGVAFRASRGGVPNKILLLVVSQNIWPLGLATLLVSSNSRNG